MEKKVVVFHTGEQRPTELHCESVEIDGPVFRFTRPGRILLIPIASVESVSVFDQDPSSRVAEGAS